MQHSNTHKEWIARKSYAELRQLDWWKSEKLQKIHKPIHNCSIRAAVVDGAFDPCIPEEPIDWALEEVEQRIGLAYELGPSENEACETNKLKIIISKPRLIWPSQIDKYWWAQEKSGCSASRKIV